MTEKTINHKGQVFNLSIKSNELWVGKKNLSGSKTSELVQTDKKVTKIDENVIQIAKDFIDRSAIFRVV